MISILVRDLDESVKRQFAERAERYGRSIRAEARDILTKGVARLNIGLALIQAVQEAGGVNGLSVPERDGVAWTEQTLT